jgi:hypothetical protein
LTPGGICYGHKARKRCVSQKRADFHRLFDRADSIFSSTSGCPRTRSRTLSDICQTSRWSPGFRWTEAVL